MLGQETLVLNNWSSGHKGDEGGHQALASLPWRPPPGRLSREQRRQGSFNCGLLVLKGTSKRKAAQK